MFYLFFPLFIASVVISYFVLDRKKTNISADYVFKGFAFGIIIGVAAGFLLRIFIFPILIFGIAGLLFGLYRNRDKRV